MNKKILLTIGFTWSTYFYKIYAGTKEHQNIDKKLCSFVSFNYFLMVTFVFVIRMNSV